MPSPFDPQPWYKPERDGTLGEYLQRRDGSLSFPVFGGSEVYQVLWEKGYLLPNVSVIRLMWNMGRGDEHFEVVNASTMKGLNVPVHAETPGLHQVVEILTMDSPLWEALYLAPEPKQR